MTSSSDSEYKKWEEKCKRREERKKHQEEIAKKNSEKIVVNRIVERANSQRWETDEKHVHPGETGIDLKLKKSDHRLLVIEAKGERAQRNAKGRVASALGQVIMDMKDEKPEKIYGYCLAFPFTEGFEKVVYKIPSKARHRLGLNIIFVDCSTGLLKVLLPSGKDAKDAIDLSSFGELFHAD